MGVDYGLAADDSKYAEIFLKAMEDKLSFFRGERSPELGLFSEMLFELKYRENHQVNRIEHLDLKFCMPVWKLAHTGISTDDACPKELTLRGVVDWFNYVVAIAPNQTVYGKDRVIAVRVLEKLVKSFKEAIEDGSLKPKLEVEGPVKRFFI